LRDTTSYNKRDLLLMKSIAYGYLMHPNCRR
jgi:hypothetical protein